jgi:hypothetical protein
MADVKKIIKGVVDLPSHLKEAVESAHAPKVFYSTAGRLADKISEANPKMSEYEVMRRAFDQSTKKLDWERVDKPALEKTYGDLGGSTFTDSKVKRMRNTPAVVEERKRAANEFLDQPTEPWVPPKPELQAFDRSSIKDALEGFPDVPQSVFPRDIPPRASTKHVDELYTDPANRELIKKQIMRGLPLGGESFYASLYPVKQAVLEAGMPASKFDSWVHSMAPASARNSIMNEMAVGQFLRNLHSQGIPLTPENVKREMAAFKEQFGIGLPLFDGHRLGVANVLENNLNLRDLSQANIPTNYKIPTYGAQKTGDFAHSATLDVHEAAGQTQGSRSHPYFTEAGGFGNTEYNAGEQGFLGIAKELGLPGGMAQAGRWFGGGELTGLKSPRGDALDLLEKQFAFSLLHQGRQPNPANIRSEVLKQIETGEGMLLPWYRKEGMPDVRTTGLQRKDGGQVEHMQAGGIKKGLGVLEDVANSLLKPKPALSPYQLANQKAPLFGQSADPYARSLQQGFEHGWNHGTTGDITSFDRALLGETTGANSAKKGFFFARDPQNPPEHLKYKSNDPQTIEMLRKAGVDVDEYNKVSFEGHGADTASGYSVLGGDREYKEALRKAKAAETRGNWDEQEKWSQIAEDHEISRMNRDQGLVAKHNDARDVMLDKIQRGFYDPMAGKSQAELSAFDRKYEKMFPANWWNSPFSQQLSSIKSNVINHLGETNAAPVLDAIKQFELARNERMLAENIQSGSNVIPAALRYKNPLVHDFQGNTYRDQTYSDLVDQALKNNHDALILKNTYDSGAGTSKLIDVGVVFDPKNIRSKFAAFDPEHIDSADISKAEGGRVEHMQAGGLKTLMGEVLNKGGTYAARRLQRAADEIPNLEKLFQEEALRRAFAGGDNASAVMTMNPADFEKYSIPIHPYFTTKKFPTLVKDDYSTDDWVKHLKTVQGYDQVPHLAVDKGEVGADMLPIIIGHEGRHRNRALADKGVTSSLIQFKPRGDLREALPLESQEQYIDSIRKEMQLTGNRVKPEQYYDPVADQEVRRRAIAMPDLYAEGGVVHKQVGGAMGVLERVAAMKAANAAAKTPKLLAPLERQYALEQFKAGSADPRQFYHGSRQYYTDDVTGKTMRAPEQGFTNLQTPSQLKNWNYENNADAVFLTPESSFSNAFAGDIKDELARPAVYPVHAQVKNPFDIHNKDHAKALIDAYRRLHIAPDDVEKLGRFEKDVAFAQRDPANWATLENNRVQDAIKSLGHDSFYVTENGVKNLGVYNPNLVKSSLGNRGTFDINEADMSKAEGGAVHSQAEDGDIMRQLFDHALDNGDIHEMTHAMLVKQHEAEYG